VLDAEGRALAQRLRDAGNDAQFIALDQAAPASVTAFVEEGARVLGGLDGRVHNAAIPNSGGTRATELSIETWDAVMNV
ncbi:SDR family oxidoreductase, partial [Burkholderia pseudomallei]